MACHEARSTAAVLFVIYRGIGLLCLNHFVTSCSIALGLSRQQCSNLSIHRYSALYAPLYRLGARDPSAFHQKKEAGLNRNSTQPPSRFPCPPQSVTLLVMLLSAS